MLTLRPASQSRLTRGVLLARSSATRKSKRRSHGTELSKNTPCCRRMSTGLLVGLNVVSLVHRGLTTVVLVPIRLSVTILLMHIIRLAFTLASTLAVSMAKLYLFRRMNCGWHATFLRYSHIPIVFVFWIHVFVKNPQILTLSFKIYRQCEIKVIDLESSCFKND
ncbi:hypothetical protein HanHA300_Chr14g0515181 [Helianthus annuus]|nr:hypothetical protein HanHA300_Chr14g0515181 [Helianthus annuus]